MFSALLRPYDRAMFKNPLVYVKKIQDLLRLYKDFTLHSTVYTGCPESFGRFPECFALLDTLYIHSRTQRTKALISYEISVS